MAEETQIDAGTTGNEEPAIPAGNEAEKGGDTLLTSTDEEGDALKEAEDGKGGGESEKEKGEPGKPEPYEIEAPEGYPITPENLKSLNAHFNELGLTKEQAEKALAYRAEQYAAFQASQQAQRKSWITEIQADKEYGGEKFKETVADAKRALAQFDEGGTIRTLLEETGYGDNPAIIKVFAKVGRAMAEDKIVGKGGAGGKKPLAERLYSNM